MHAARPLLVLATSIVLSACGGGGGGGGDSAPTGTGTTAAATPTPAPYIPPAADAVSADAPLLTAVAIPMVAGSLIISEISSGTYAGDHWIEIYNPNSVAVDISGVKLRSSSNSGTSEFTLPSTVIAANGYVVVAAKSATNLISTQQIAFVENGTQLPYWGTSGFVELFNPVGNVTVDFVRFGSDSTQPKTLAAWSGSNAPALPATYGSSLVRPVANISNDSNSAIDFQVVSFITPAGPNDIAANAVDADNDGIPDSAEVLGGRFAGLDLYAMGARAGIKDIFIELDYMSSVDEGVKPRPEALKKVVDAFARKNIAVHFDTGSNIAGYNLGNTQSVLPFNACLDLGTPKAGCADVYVLKAKYFDLRRQPIFHYAVAGYEAGSGGAGIAGRGEIAGNDFNITLGNSKLTAANTADKNFLINQQASTLMHELGHNLGLHHGGFEANNYKPNYISIMNYLYNTGIPPNVTGMNAGQRWYINNGMKNLYTCSAAVEANMCSDSFIIDFSDGSSSDLDETSLLESNLLGRGSSTGAYIDWNGDRLLTGMSVSVNIDAPDNFSKTVLKDYNDWQNINLAFSRQVNGARSLRVNHSTVQSDIHLLNDRQTVAQEFPTRKTQ
ncbi:lamin tail domain-containing protein [Deefgea rivuli]|uniref:lamin tail domain-containing protein n=1 Tax=Deefgea rivuli TaxID=400948 RepID=UPI000688DEF9|nr:lamin tail domain-containing protein [Deefgea rivuli]